MLENIKKMEVNKVLFIKTKNHQIKEMKTKIHKNMGFFPRKKAIPNAL
jgi:hypothetical protein